MALGQLRPFNEATYASSVQPFVNFAVPYVERTPIQGHTGWLSHLRSYNWRGDDWQAGLATRYRLRQTLAICSNDQQFLDAVNGVMVWGGLKPFALNRVPLLRRSLAALDSIDGKGANRWPEIYAKRIAAVTKVYAFHALEKWSIYDSRVANGLAMLVSAYWSGKREGHLADLLRFPQPRARGEGRVPPPGFPRDSAGQSRLAFLYSSWLSRAIAISLNTGSGISKPPSVSLDGDSAFPSSWKVCHVEMVLFMLGK